MKKYRLAYQVPYLFDDGSESKDLLWGTQTHDFEAEDDVAACAYVAEKFATRTVELKEHGKIERWHYSINRLEEVARDIKLPDLPMNAKQVH